MLLLDENIEESYEPRDKTFEQTREGKQENTAVTNKFIPLLNKHYINSDTLSGDDILHFKSASKLFKAKSG